MPRLSTVMTATPVAGKLLPQLDAEGYLPEELMPKGYSASGLGSWVQVGEVLNASTAEAALNAFLAAAYASTDEGGMAVLVPPGDFNMVNTVEVKARSGYKRAPLIQCAGQGQTRWIYAALPAGQTGQGRGVAFWFNGGHSAAAGTTIYYGGLRDCEIVFSGDHGGTGVYAEGLLFTDFANVAVRGGQTLVSISGQTGSASSCGAADSQGLQTRSGMSGMTEDSVGREVAFTGATTSANNGTFLVMHYVSPTSVKVYNPSGTSDASNGSLGWTEKMSGRGFVFRGDYTNSMGVAVTNNQNVRMHGCVAGQGRKGFWIESCYPLFMTACESNQNATHDVLLGHNVVLNWTGGMWQSAHGGACVFEIPGKVGGRSCTFDTVYQEGAVENVFRMFAPVSGVSDYTIRACQQGNSTTYVKANGVRSLLVEAPASQASPTVWAHLTACGTAQFRGGAFEDYTANTTKWVLDLQSRAGFSVHGQARPYSGSGSAARSLNTFLKGQADLMAEIWDPRIPGLRTVNAGKLEALVGCIAGISAGPENAAIYPNWTAVDANFGDQPSWTNVAGAAAACAALKATMTLGALPVGSQPGILVVAKLPTVTSVGGGHYQMMQWTDGTNYQQLGACDAVDSNQWYTNTYPLNSGNPALGSVATTNAQAVYGGLAWDPDSSLVYLANVDGVLESGTGPSFAAYSSAAAGVLRFFGPAGGSAVVDNAVSIAWAGLTRRGMTESEMRIALDLMCSEFRLGRC